MSFRILDANGVLLQEVLTSVSRITGGSELNITDVNTDKELLVHDQSVVDTINSLAIANVNADKVYGAEFSISAKVETDVPGVTYTVATGKTFYLVGFACSCDSPAPIGFKLKVAGTVVKAIRLGAASGGTTGQLIYPIPTKLATAGQIIKITYDAQLNRGTGWTEFVGLER